MSGLNVGNLYASLRLDSSQFERGVDSARGTLNTLDSALAAAKAATGTVGTLDPRLGTSTAAAVAQVENLRAAAIRAAAAAQGVTLDDNIVRQAAKSAASIEDIATAIAQAGGKAPGTAAAVGQIGQQGQAAAGDVAKIEAALQAATAGAGTLANAVGQTGAQGAPAGAEAGAGFLDRFKDGVGDLAGKAGPIAGALLGVAAIGLTAGALLIGAIREGMGVEVSQDLFAAQTGLDPATVQKFGLAAGEAFGNAFGESVEANLGAAKAAVQTGLLDPKASQADVQAVIEQLTGVSSILGEEIPATARAASQAIKTGIATDAAGAFDLLVKGSQAGLNVSEDWLDTVTEYGTQFRKLGLDGPHAVGLLGQAMQGGARDTDLAADALKEFSIRAVDGSTTSATAYEQIGLNAKEMTEQIAKGGPDAAAGLATVLDGLRAIEDPALRAQAATGLFGTQAEDLGQALYGMDFNTATAGMEGFSGAAATAVSIMGDNASSAVEGALNSITAAKQGLEAALAQAVGPYISDFANTIANNREAVIGFFIDLGNAGFDGARALITALASTTGPMAGLVEGIGAMASGALHALQPLVSGAADLIALVPGMDGMADDLHAAADGMGQFADAADSGSTMAADALRSVGDSLTNTVLPGLDVAQGKFNDFALPVQQTAAFNDVVTKVNSTIAGLSTAADGSTISLAGQAGQLDLNSEKQRQLADSLTGLSGQLRQQVTDGLAAGATVGQLSVQYGANRDALIAQATQMGFTADEAEALANRYGLIPDLVNTVIKADSSQAQGTVDRLIRDNTGREIGVKVRVTSSTTGFAVGGSNVALLDGVRAAGGPVLADGNYLVGENGPEIITPDKAGFVIPAPETAAIMAGRAAGTSARSAVPVAGATYSSVYNITPAREQSSEEIAAEIDRRQARRARGL